MHHREWNPKAFIRHLTPIALAELQEWAEVELALDGEGLPWERAYRAWMALPEDVRLRVETELLAVNDMCSRHARPYLEHAAPLVWCNGDANLVEESREWSAHDLAVRLFIADPKRFAEAHQSYAVDMMDHFREFQGRYDVSLVPTREAKRRMKAAIEAHLRGTAFGARCQVEDFANDQKFAIFVYHEDEMAPFDRFNDQGVIEPDWQRPVVRLAAVFHHESCTLLVKASRKAEREKLRDLFAALIVGDKDYFTDTSNSPKYCFDAIRDPEFDFPTRGIDKIDEVSVVRVVAQSSHRDAKRLTLEMKPGLSIEGVRMVLDEHGVDLANDPIDGIRLQFMFQGKGRSKYRTVSLFNPSSSNLNDTDRDRVIRRYLKEWGIDAGARAALEAAAAAPAA